MKTKITTLAIIAIIMLGCNSGKKSTTESIKVSSDTTHETISTIDTATTKNSNIENIQWTLSVLEGHKVHKLNATDQDIHFTLTPDGNRVSGFSGCNTFIGTYSLDNGNRIKFSKMASTKKACPAAAINEAELLSVFEMADNYTLNDGTLKLNIAKRTPLAEFKKVELINEPIVEKYWKLKTLEGHDVEMVKNQEREIFFMLKSKDNRVTGFAGCNTISGSYTLEKGNRIHFSEMATTLKMCPDVAVNESNFLKTFELADNYTVNDDVLSLNVGRRAPLAVFEAVYFN